MKPLHVSALVFLMIAAVLLSQSRPGPQPQTSIDENAWLRRLMLEQVDTQPDMQLAERKAAQERERMFDEKVNDFTTKFNALTAELGGAGTFNIKKAEASEKAWNRMLDDPGWLRKKK